jgi:hypothetical protein
MFFSIFCHLKDVYKNYQQLQVIDKFYKNVGYKPVLIVVVIKLYKMSDQRDII